MTDTIDALRKARETFKGIVAALTVGGDGEARLACSLAQGGLRATAEALAALKLSARAPVAIPVGWKFNHARQCDEDGVWEIGYLNEDDYFSSIVTVDTGLYYQPQDAEPLARAILARLTAPPPIEAQAGEPKPHDRCKFANGGARCVRWCGDLVCQKSGPT